MLANGNSDLFSNQNCFCNSLFHAVYAALYLSVLIKKEKRKKCRPLIKESYSANGAIATTEEREEVWGS